MDRITGRSDDMLIINGVNVFPSQIESLLTDFREVELQYALFVGKKKHLDQLKLKVEAKQDLYDAGRQKLDEVEQKIAHHIKGMLGISVTIEVTAPKTIARSEGKAVRVIDERPK
jgi:phenylacetate-CoA ligase